MSTSTRSEAPKDLDLEWAARELVPFLQLVFGQKYGRENRSTAYWVGMVLFAQSRIDRVPFHEDFPSTIERLRLCLVNWDILTALELAKFARVVIQGELLCIRIFVRHAIRHGTYELYSLGSDASPNFPRPGKADRVERSSIKLPEPDYAAVMEELQKQLNNPSISVKKGGSSRKRAIARHYSDLSHVRYLNNDSDVSVAHSNRPPHPMSHPNVPSGHAPGPLLESHISSPIPKNWQNHPAISQYGYLQPYRPSVPATTHTSMPQYYQQYPPYMQNQNFGQAWSTHWSNRSWADHAMSYHLPQASSFLPAMGDSYAAQPPPAAIANQPVMRYFMPGQEQAVLAHTAMDAHIPRPDAQEFIPGAVRKF